MDKVKTIRQKLHFYNWMIITKSVLCSLSYYLYNQHRNVENELIKYLLSGIESCIMHRTVQ